MKIRRRRHKVRVARYSTKGNCFYKGRYRFKDKDTIRSPYHPKDLPGYHNGKPVHKWVMLSPSDDDFGSLYGAVYEHIKKQQNFVSRYYRKLRNYFSHKSQEEKH